MPRKPRKKDSDISVKSPNGYMNRIDDALDRIEKLENKMEDFLQRMDMERGDPLDRPPMTERERDAHLRLERVGLQGYGVWELAKERNISYTASYKILESLRKKGYIEEEWSTKGHKKKYRIIK